MLEQPPMEGREAADRLRRTRYVDEAAEKHRVDKTLSVKREAGLRNLRMKF